MTIFPWEEIGIWADWVNFPIARSDDKPAENGIMFLFLFFFPTNVNFWEKDNEVRHDVFFPTNGRARSIAPIASFFSTDSAGDSSEKSDCAGDSSKKKNTSTPYK